MTTQTADHDADQKRKGTANDVLCSFHPVPPQKPIAELRPFLTVIPRLPTLANTNQCNWQSGQAGLPTRVQTHAPVGDMHHKASSTAAQLRDAINSRHTSVSAPTDPCQLRSRTGAMIVITEATAQATMQISMTNTPVPAQHRSISVRQVHAQQAAAAATRSSHATPGIPTAFLPRPGPLGPTENPEEAWDRRQANAMYLLVSGVADTSATTYCTGWKHWLAMCSEYAMDPFLQVPPTLSTRTPMRIQLPFPITAVLHYIAYLAEGKGGNRKLKATTIIDYVTAVRHFLQINLVDVTFMHDQPNNYESKVRTGDRGTLR